MQVIRARTLLWVIEVIEVTAVAVDAKDAAHATWHSGPPRHNWIDIVSVTNNVMRKKEQQKYYVYLHIDKKH